MRTLTIIAGASLAVAALDVGFAITPWSDHWRTAGATLRTTPWMLLAVFAAGLLVAAAFWPVRRRLARPDDLFAAAAVAAIAGFGVGSHFGLVAMAQQPGAYLGKIALAAVIALTAGGLIYRFKGAAKRFASAGLAVAAGAAICWVGVYQASSPTARYALWAGGAAAVFLVWLWFSKLPDKLQAVGASSVLAVTTLSGFWLSERPEVYFQPVQQPPLTAASGPSILLLSIDTLRRDAISFYNPNTPSTPHLDSLAQDSIVFDGAFSSGSWTLPSMTAAMTGMRARTQIMEGESWRVPERAPLLAELLAAAGYRTGAAVDNGWLRADAGFGRGFETYAHFPREAESIGSRLDRNIGVDTTQTLTWLASEWIQAHRDQTFFFWLHYFDPHGPYRPSGAFRPQGPPPPGSGWSFGSIGYRADMKRRLRAGSYRPPSSEQADWVRKLYHGEVQYVDHEVGKLLDYLRANGLYDDIAILVFADHGDEHWEHGQWGHAHSVFNELTHVPLMLKPPGRRPGARVAREVSTRRVFRTVLDIAGVEPGPCDQSASLLDAWESPDKLDPGLVIYSKSTGRVRQDALVWNGRKTVRAEGERALTVYDLEHDPMELSSLQPSDEQGAELNRRLDLHLQAAALQRNCLALDGEGATPRMDPRAVERLKNLGYLQ